MAKRKERHTALIYDLERVMFPFQESEEEQESFTDIGRQRVDEWLDKVLAAPASHEGEARLKCMDCDAVYAEFPLDLTLPDEQWRLIHDSDGGILCASCIVRRAGKLSGAVAVRAQIEFAAAPAAGEQP